MTSLQKGENMLIDFEHREQHDGENLHVVRARACILPVSSRKNNSSYYYTARTLA